MRALNEKTFVTPVRIGNVTLYFMLCLESSLKLEHNIKKDGISNILYVISNALQCWSSIRKDWFSRDISAGPTLVEIIYGVEFN